MNEKNCTKKKNTPPKLHATKVKNWYWNKEEKMEKIRLELSDLPNLTKSRRIKCDILYDSYLNDRERKLESMKLKWYFVPKFI